MLAWLRRHPDLPFEARVRRELRQAADAVDPDLGGLAAIRARTRKGEPWPSPQSQPSGPGSTHAPA